MTRSNCDLACLLRKIRAVFFCTAVLLGGRFAAPVAAQITPLEPGTEGQMWQSLPVWGQQNIIGTPFFCLNSDPPQIDENTGILLQPTVGDDPGAVANFLEANRTCTIGGTPGQPPPLGQFLFPYAVAVDGLTLFVTDQYNHRVQAFTAQTSGVPTILPLASPIGDGKYADLVNDQKNLKHLNAPAGLKVLPVKNTTQHVLAVADSGNYRIAFFDTVTGAPAFSAHFPLANNGDGSTPVAYDLAAQPGTKLQFDGQVRAATGSGIIVVPDVLNCYVQVYDDGLNLLREIPTQAAFAAALADTMNPLGPFNDGQGGACVAQDEAGNLPPTGFFGSPGGAAVDAAGHIFIADYLNSRIQVFSSNGTFLISFGTPPAGLPAGSLPPPGTLQAPYALTFDHLNRLIVTDSQNERIAFFSVDFTQTPPVPSYLFQLNAAGTLNGSPTGIVEQILPDPAGRIFVTDTTNHRVQWFQLPDLAIISPSISAPSAGAGTGTFSVAVPAQKVLGVTGVTAAAGGVTLPACFFLGADDLSNCINNPAPVTGDGVTSVDGNAVGAAVAVSPQPLAPSISVAPGQMATFGFAYNTSAPVPNFELDAHGNGVSGSTPCSFATCAPTVYATPAVACSDCGSSAATLKRSTLAPVTPYVAGTDNWFNTPLIVRITATGTSGFLGGLKYQFTSGPNSGAIKSVSAASGAASLTVDAVIPNESYNNVLQFWAYDVDGSEEQDHHGASYSIDLTAPTVTFTYNGSLNASNTTWYNATTAPVTVAFTVSDNGGSGTASASSPSGPSVTFSTEGLNFQQSVTATDNVGNTSSPAAKSQLVNIDLTAPTFVSGALPASVTYELANSSGLGTLVLNSAADSKFKGWVSTPSTLATDPALADAGHSAGSGLARITVPAAGTTATTSVTVTVTDVAGNSASANIPVVVTDTTPPTISCSATPLSLSLLGLTIALPDVTGSLFVSASDISGSVTLSQSPAIGALLGFGNSNITVTAKDASNNSSSCTVKVSVGDSAPPVITVPNNISVTVPTSAGVKVTYTLPSATDNVTSPQPLVCTSAPTAGLTSGSTFPVGTTTITCSATDAAGNKATSAFTVSVVLNGTPTITVSPVTQTVEATSPSGAAANFTATYTDPFDASSGNATCKLPSGAVVTSGATFPIATTTVTCSYTSTHGGGTGSATLTVIVKDSTAPVLTVPTSPVVAEATSVSGAAVSFTVTGTDVASAPVVVTCMPASGSTFAIGTKTVSCTGKDSAGNTSAASTFVVKVQDTTPPVLSLPSPVAEATGPSGAAVSFTASGTDTASASVTVSCNPPSGSTFHLGSTTVTCTGTDAHTNSTTGTFVVKVQDTTAPAVSVPASFTLGATSASGVAVTYNATAVDLVDGSRPLTCTPASGTVFPVGTTTVTCSGATDLSGNTAPAKTFQVTVTNAPPKITQSNIVAIATSAAGAPVLFKPQVTDPSDPNPVVTCSPKSSGSTFPIGTTTETCTAKNRLGLTASVTFTVTINHTAPVCTSATPSTGSLWPPNHQLVSISIKGLTTVDGGTITTVIKSIFQDEPTDGLGDGDTPIDGFGLGTSVAQVRSERSGSMDGRFYYIGFTATTPGGSCSGTVTVVVPHDQGHNAVGQGAKYDSTKESKLPNDTCHGQSSHGHHDGDGCIAGHHGHYVGDNCKGSGGYDHDGDGHSASDHNHH